MKWLAFVVVLVACAHLQGQYNALTATRPIQSVDDQVDLQPINNGAEFIYSATSGNCVIGVLGWANNPTSNVVIKDNSGNTLNTGASFSAGSGQRLELFWETVPSTGTFYVQSQTDFNGMSEQFGISMAEFSSATTSCTPDGSQSTSGGVGGSSRSASVTTTDNGELAVGGASAQTGNTFIQAPIWPTYFGAFNTAIGASLHFKNCGAAGSCSVGNNLNSGSSANNAIAVMAFLPPAQAISTSALHDCASGVAYSDILTDIGGTGTPTWTVTVGSLPTGLSLNSSTGAITGSGCTGTSTFTVSDGVASKSLTITARPSFVSPVVNSVGPGNAACPGGSPLNDCSATFTAAFGHMGLAVMFGPDSASNGYIAINNVQDTLGCSDVWIRAEGLPGISQGPIQFYTTTFKCSGTAQVGIIQGSFGGSPVNMWVADITGQAILDAGAGVTDTSGSNVTTSNFNAQVANELLVAVGIYNQCSSQTLTINSPFTAIYTPGCNIINSSMVVATRNVTAAGNYTVADTIIGAAGGPPAEALGLWGIRPAFIASAPANFLGERRKHHAGN